MLGKARLTSRQACTPLWMCAKAFPRVLDAAPVVRPPLRFNHTALVTGQSQPSPPGALEMREGYAQLPWDCCVSTPDNCMENSSDEPKSAQFYIDTGELSQRLQPVAIVGPYQDTGGGWILPSKPQPLHNNTNNIMDNNKLSPTFAQRRAEVKLNAMPWFHGKISRDQAEQLLSPKEDGLFLVRESTNFPGDYTLCVCYQGKVEHYRVKYKDHQLTIDDEEFFENLAQLVEHYEQDADGLCTQLVKSLPKKGKQDFCVDTKAFEKAGWVIPENELELRESIGKGEFGDVMLGILRGEKVAVKMLKDSSEAAQKFLAEATLMT
uniref:Tyrosine-protein kinase n=1 Tax=Timema poppense TaxID=170557 RepID=A0A7R9H3Z8_TIMPO|nr:unnamed protein product [Timema poppensis]